MIPNLQTVIELAENNWKQAHILVIGDVMLDRYIWGEVSRVSPEAPVPIVRRVHHSEQPGGAANVAMNISKVGASVTLLGFGGEDEPGAALVRLLSEAQVEAEIIPLASRPTTTKLRIIGGTQQMLRLDTEETGSYNGEAFAALLARIDAKLPTTTAVVLSDYAKGTLSEEVCRHTIARARALGIPVIVDPKQRDFSRYHGATTICPNLNELSLGSGIPASELDALLTAGQAMAADLELDYMTVTMSDKGIAVLRPDSRTLFPAVARQIFDVSGAGDTVVAVLALSLAAGLGIETAVPLANLAAGIVIAKPGTVPVTRHELVAALMPEIELQATEKVLSLERMVKRVAAWRSNGERVVFTNGCFDLLHIGHIRLLESARNEGDRLVVGINSDRSVSDLKGPTRPIVGEQERAHVLAALTAVDGVVIFGEPTPIRLVEALRPDVLIKGGDYNEATTVGAKEVRSWGGMVKFVPIVQGFSTTKLIARAATPEE